MGDYRDLQVWQRAAALARRLDEESRSFDRGHGAAGDQLRRAALSIPTNLAEGACKGRDAEFIRFISISIGSAAEVESLLAHLRGVGAIDERTYSALTADLTIIRKMLFRLRLALRPASHTRP